MDGSLNFKSEERKSVQNLFDRFHEKSNKVGDNVLIIHGKHTGKTGTIFWLGKDKFKREYGSDFSCVLSDISKAYGWRAGIKTAEGETFFCDASYIYRKDDPWHKKILETNSIVREMVENYVNF